MATLSVNAVHYREQALRCLGGLPAFSPVLNRLVADLGKEHVSFSDLADLIEKDTVLTGSVLRVVNSALYGLRGTVNSVRHAVSLMGLAKLRNTALGLSIANMWRRVRTPPGFNASRFNQHSVAAAILCDLLAQRAPVEYAEGAFTAALLHDVGKLLTAVALGEEYEQIERLQRLTGAELVECESEVLGFTHAALSAAVLGRWNLPRPIQMAVRDHHSPRPPQDGVRGLADIVCAADAIANQLRMSVQPPPDRSAPSPEPVFARLGLAASTDGILAEFRGEFEIIRDFF